MRITPKQLALTLCDLTDGETRPEIQKSVADFARYIYKERKLKLAEKIIEQFGKIWNERKGIVEVEVVTRKKLGEAELKKIRSFAKEKYRTKEVVLNNVIDENIKGGLIIKIGDEVVDGSISGRLSQLKNILAG